MHLKWIVRGEADRWVHGRMQGNASLLRAKIMIPPPDIMDPPKGPLYFAKKTLSPLTARTHQLYLRTQGSASLLRTKKMNTPPVSWDPV